jgi:Surfeit locus protein 5 subunit 22 of Mediator complex
MNTLSDPPPPPLAADVALSTLQCQLAGENLCAAASQLLDICRTLRLAILLMDDDTIAAEEECQVAETKARTQTATEQATALEQQYLEVLQEQMG